MIHKEIMTCNMNGKELMINCYYVSACCTYVCTHTNTHTHAYTNVHLTHCIIILFDRIMGSNSVNNDNGSSNDNDNNDDDDD